MASEVDLSDASSSSSQDTSGDIHHFDEEEEAVNVSSLKEELMAEFKRSMEAELNDMRVEVSKLRAERDRAVNEVKQLRDLLMSKANVPDDASNTRTPPRKVAKVWTESNSGTTATSVNFPALPARSAAVSGFTEKPKKTSPLPVIAGANATASTSQGFAASASTSRGAAGRISAAAASNVTANESRKYQKILQAINTDVFKIRLVLISANVHNFLVKQASKKGPVKITLTNAGEVATAKKALAAAKISFHEFKTPEEKLKCYVIRGLIGATEEKLPFIKEQLVLAGIPDTVSVSLHVTGFMRANPSSDFSAPVKMVVPPGFDDKVLIPIKHINRMAVRFELFKSKSVIQCKNCQRFGHSASGCQHEHRCVKCGINHFRDSCPRTRDSSAKLTCCNCGGDHTANNLNNCSFFLERYASSNKAAIPATPIAVVKRPPPAPIQSGISFAEVVSSNRRQHVPLGGSRPRNGTNLPNSNLNNTNFNFNNNISSFSDALTMLSGQLGQIMAKLEEHSQMWSRHDKLINILMSNAINGQ